VYRPGAAWVEATAYCHACSPSPFGGILLAVAMMVRGPDEGRWEPAQVPAVVKDVPAPAGDVDEGAVDAADAEAEGHR
jgi:hypothetical protein